MTVPFIDLRAQRLRMGNAIEEHVLEVVREGNYILGPQVSALEEALQKFANVNHVITCANGTDALELVLRAQGIGPGDAVFVPAFTYIASAEVIALVGATPVFVDVDPETFLIDLIHLKASIEDVCAQKNLTPRAIISVDLFGLPAPYPLLTSLADKEGLLVIGDSAQGFGSTLGGLSSVSYGFAATTSFFPAKPLGCYGDGGAIFTQDEDLAQRLLSLRFHGRGEDRYDHIQIGRNSRLDTIQAAILLEKLKLYPEELIARQRAADIYTQGLSKVVETPRIPPNATSIWAQYTIKFKGSPEQASTQRETVRSALQKSGIPTMVYYTMGAHQQVGYRHFPVGPGGVPVTEDLTQRVLSLPMHGYLSSTLQETIIRTICENLSA